MSPLDTTGEPDPNATVAEQPSGDAAASVAGTVGRYRLVRFHAKGGLGEVYVAADTELGREVALKRIRAERADERSTERFVREAEITGRLEHPGIVPVYGLIRDEGGRPVYAMRFIAGDTLKDAIDRFHASGAAFESVAFRGLLGRFAATCNAVAYAHSRGVIHRDLKPANVMLGEYGETLVVDWGLAKRAGSVSDGLGASVADASGSSETQVGQVVGTPAYMPPEQARGETVGPSADVYALGAILHHLLTGRTPVTGASVREVLEKVERGDVSAPRTMNPRVPKPLDAIARKAMSRHPEDRYPGATALAAEVERWLADEPVSAYREPFAVRARRWMRQHRTLVTTATVALLLTAVGLTVGVVLLNAAKEREREAKFEAQAKRKLAREAFDTVLSQESLGWLKTQKELLPEQKQFLETALTYYQQFAADAATDEDARAMVALANSRGSYLFQALGRPAEAEPYCRQAIDRWQSLAADFPTAPKYRQDLAGSRLNLGLLLTFSGKRAEAEATFRAALSDTQALVADFPDVPEYRRDLGRVHHNFGNLLMDLETPGEAEAAFRAAWAIFQQLAVDFPAVPEYRWLLAASYDSLGGLLDVRGKRGEAQTAYREAQATFQKLTADFPAVSKYHRDLARSRYNLAILLADLGKRAEAEAAYREALATYQKLASDFRTDPEYRLELAGTCCNCGNAIRDQGRAAESLDWYTRAAALLQSQDVQGSRNATARDSLWNCYAGRAAALDDLMRYAEAEADWAKAVELSEPRKRPRTRLLRAWSLAMAGQHARVFEAVNDLVADPNRSAEDIFNTAKFFSLLTGAANDDAPLREKYATEAVELLKRAIAAGFKDAAHLRKDTDLGAIRDRADFQQLLDDLEKKPNP